MYIGNGCLAPKTSMKQCSIAPQGSERPGSSLTRPVSQQGVITASEINIQFD